MYADMYNREYDGGGDVLDKILVGGVPVDHIVPSISKDSPKEFGDDSSQDGGKSQKKYNGPLDHKVVPVGLVFIPTHKDRDVEYDDTIHFGANREVVPESLYDMLFRSVMVEKRRNQTPKNRAKNKDKKTRRK
jgi:hypothetical protein